MKRFILALGLLAGAPAMAQTLQHGGLTLAEIATNNGVDPAAVVRSGVLLCGVSVGSDGVLTSNRIVAVVGVHQMPVAVKDQSAADVRKACPIGMIPGALPADADPNAIPMMQAQTDLPHVAVQ